VDREGNLCPNADPRVTFRIRGPGRIAGVDNGDPTSHESFQGQSHRAFHGLALVVVRSERRAGEIRLEATGDGIASEAVSIRARPPAAPARRP
jgi:beta-galactosidase